jgi:hypothetical protein
MPPEDLVSGNLVVTTFNAEVLRENCLQFGLDLVLSRPSREERPDPIAVADVLVERRWKADWIPDRPQQ